MCAPHKLNPRTVRYCGRFYQPSHESGDLPDQRLVTRAFFFISFTTSPVAERRGKKAPVSQQREDKRTACCDRMDTPSVVEDLLLIIVEVVDELHRKLDYVS